MDFRQRYGPWAAVLGASEGLGAAHARELASRGLNLVLIARRPAPLEVLAGELRAAHGIEVRTCPMDLAAADLVDQLEQTADLDIGLVVYNACFSPIGHFLDISLEDKLKTVDVNVRGPVVVAHCFGPRLVARGRGGLLLMSSLSGFQGSAMVGTYAATKAFDTVFGEGLWEELGRHGVDVLVCAAGATLTPNFEDQTPKSKRGRAYPMAPADVAAEAIAALGAGPVVVPGRTNKVVQAVLSRLFTRRAAIRFISKNTRAMYEAP